MELKRVVVGLDGSPASAAAAHWAAAAVRDCGGEILAVHGIGTFPELPHEAAEDALGGLGFSSPSGVTDRTAESRSVLEEWWCRPFREAGVPYQIVVAESDPVHALLDTARREDADMIVIGHQGNTGFLHHLFRGLSDQLVDHAKRPVVVVPYSESGRAERSSPTSGGAV